MSAKVYILEDEPDIARVMTRSLEEHGMSVTVFQRLGDLKREIGRHRPDICLVDLTLPDGDGLEVVGDILKRNGIATIIVTGRQDLSDRVIGLELGADDYISKPFEPRELIARVRAVLRRFRKQDGAESGKIARFDGFRIDFDAYELTTPTGQIHELSAAEARMLKNFLLAAGRVLSRGHLLQLDNPDAFDPDDRSIDARISKLRRKLGDNPKAPRIIRTVYGAGYVFSIKPEWDG